MKRRRLTSAGLALASVMLSGCLKPASVPPEGYDPEAIDPAIYARKDDPNDPYRSELSLIHI